MTNEELTAEALRESERLSRVEEQIRTLFNMNEEWRQMVGSVNSLATSVQIMAQEQKGLAEKVGVLSQDVADIKSRPVKRWDMVTSTIITVFATACATYFLTKLGIQ